MENYDEWSLSQLKNELRRRKARIDGKKADLVQRLKDYDVTFNQRDIIPSEDGKPTFEMDLPHPSLYRDINSDTVLPAISDDCIKVYLQLCEKRDCDMGMKMYNEKYLLCVRIASVNTFSFVKSRVASSYKSNIVYNVDVKVKDSSIDECECAAGMGPSAHCKHVCTVLCALMDFTKTKTMKTQETCTSKLQAFHKVKKLKGSPMKASCLNISKTSTSKSFSQFDPRPHNLRSSESYPSYFRNLSINFSANFPTTFPPPILQLYSLANLRACYNDHDYCQSPEKLFFLSHKLIDLSADEARKIEEATRGQISNHLWIEHRSVRIPSTTFKRICHLTEKTNLSNLLQTMTNWSEMFSKPTDHGKKYESVAV
ncbi:uncharacterized protein [Periplaneta americana]|uniref:uncharacterized protein n=1 Tax=Periplaneta americana TaxID=6978 RepID=UPI0037E96657